MPFQPTLEAETVKRGAVQPETPADTAEALADPYLYRIRDLIYRASGIFQPDNKFYIFENRCTKRLEAVGLNSFYEYFRLLTSSARRETEIRSLLNEITVGETSFFRNQPQFDAFRKVVLPQLVEAKGRLGNRHLTIWSAGCATGEEPYSLAMLLAEESQGLLRGWTLKILAVDINDNRLDRAREGIYGDYALRGVTPHFRHKYFRPRNGQQQVCDEVRSMVTFERLNILDDSRMVFLKGQDTVFCCNVLIYFGGEPKRRVIQHFHNDLNLGGYLFLGHAESLFGINNDFRLLHFPGCVAYRKISRKPSPTSVI
jgi:chemotaxis protein methyltransferase CheR